MASPDNTDSNSTREQRRGRDGDPMITLNDAITKRFPQRNEWASEALAALSDDIEPTSLVHEVAEGWMRRGAGATAELIDTLFVLTSDRLGMGRTDRDGDEPRWIELRSIVAVDAVDDSPLPLQTIELEHGDDLVVCIGWPEAFTERFIGVLVALAGGPDAGESAAETMPRELIDPTALVDDVSDLDSLSPSAWVEGSVAPAADVTVAEPDTVEPIEPIESAAPDASAVTAAELGESPESETGGDRPVVAALDFFNPTPAPEPIAEPLAMPEPPAPVPDPFSIDVAAAEAWTSLDRQHDTLPLAPGAFDDPAVKRAARMSDAWFINPHATLDSIRRTLLLAPESTARAAVLTTIDAGQATLEAVRGENRIAHRCQTAATGEQRFQGAL